MRNYRKENNGKKKVSSQKAHSKLDLKSICSNCNLIE